MSLFRRKVKNAFRTVLFNWREYAGFFLALLVVQGIFWSLTFSLDTNNRIAEKTVRASYDYHVVVPDLDNTELATMKNLINAQSGIDGSFFSVSFVTEDGVSEAHVLLRGANVEKSFAKFRDRCMMDSWSYTFTPLYTYVTEYVTPGVWRYALICICMLALCTAVLTVLYNIRIENHQFQYGIYMTCGGTFSALFGVAFLELAAIAVLTYLPSMLLSALLVLLVYLPQGQLLCVTWYAPLLVTLMCALTVLLSVLLPVRVMASKTPMALITSRDNAGLVTSPRRSFRLFGKKFPRDYEFYGMWRMRKYYVRLLCSAVAFAALFISGLYIADMITTKQQLATDEFTLAYGNMPDEEIKDEEGNVIRPIYTFEQADGINEDAAYLAQAISDMEGVAYVNADEVQRAGALLSHMLVKQECAGSYGEYGVLSTDERDGYAVATNSYQYTCVDKTWLDLAIASGLYAFEGDPYAVLNNPYAVIVSECILGAQRFDFSVGDTVCFATYVKGMLPNDQFYTRRDKILLQQLEHYTFDYGRTGTFSGEYTVCAVITKAPSSDHLTVGMRTDTYRAMTACDGARDVLTVYLEDGLSLRQADSLERKIAVLTEDFAWQYRRNGVFFDDMIADARRDNLVTAVISSFILLVSPLVWFFSQILFYRRREGEFYMLRALGGFAQEIRSLHLVAGGVLSALAFVMTLGMSYALNYLLYITVSRLLPGLGIAMAVDYNYYMPLWALALCAAVSVLCGFASCLVPYLLWEKRVRDGQRKMEE